MEQIIKSNDNNSLKICIHTLGCKVNQYESNAIIKLLNDKGFIVTENLEFCDKYIINTCAVTAEAEKKSRQIISKINKINPNALIYIIGCASQNNSQIFKSKKNVKFISGTANKNEIVNMFEKEGVYINELPKKYEEVYKTLPLKTRAYIKIQDGCNNFCTYCIIPYLRGRSRSRSIQNIKNEILSLTATVKEFILTGINMSDYGKDNSSSLSDLVNCLSDVKQRIRISSLENGIVDEKLLQSLKKLQNFCPHFHLSLQSGSNNVLKSMNRHYNVEDFYNSIVLIEKYFPWAAVTTDIICGFPTETEDDFNKTADFCIKAGFADIHIFNYSARKGTKAAEFKQVDSIVKKQRSKKLSNIKQKLKTEFIQKNIGKELTILTETYENGYYTGYSENYLKLYVKGDIKLNELYKVIPVKQYQDGIIAEIKK